MKLTGGFGDRWVNFYGAPLALDPILTSSGLGNWSTGFESGTLFMMFSFLIDNDLKLSETLKLAKGCRNFSGYKADACNFSELSLLLLFLLLSREFTEQRLCVRLPKTGHMC